MKRYIRSGWNPLTGMEEPDDETVVKPIKEEITDDHILFQHRTFNVYDYYRFIDGKLCVKLPEGWRVEPKRVYRIAGNFNIYIDSFPNAGLPYSMYYIADRSTGIVYRAQVTQGLGNERAFLRDLVDWLKTQ